MSTLRQTRLTKSALAAAVALSLGAGAMANRAYANTYGFSFAGEFTMLQPAGTGTSSGAPMVNTSANANSWKGYRTDITGTLSYDTTTGVGSGTIAPFTFFGATAAAQNFTFQAIGNGTCTNNDPTQYPAGCGAGNLMLGNMLFNWNTTIGIPVSVVMDATGFFNAIGQVSTSNPVITGVGVLPASNYMDNAKYPIGDVPIAMTTSNTTNCGAAALNLHPSGCLPLIADTVVPYGYNPAQTGIGGNPMIAGPFGGFNANFDFTKLIATSINGAAVPPMVTTTSPTASSTSANPLTTPIQITFSEPMQESTVAATFTLTSGGNPGAGTVTPNVSGQYAAQFTFTPTQTLAYSTAYTASVSTGATSELGTPLSQAYTWNFTTMAAPVVFSCTPSTVVPNAGTAGNFTMLTGQGTAFGGTNDVLHTWDGTTNNTVNGTNFDMTISSVTPFDGFAWTAHDIRAFAPGTYTFNTGCTAPELRAGTLPSQCAAQGAPLTLTVNLGQVGALMLFDWNTTKDIYVADVWNQHAPWSSGPGTENGLWTGPTWGGPSGLMVNPKTNWTLASTAGTSNGINGIPMVNGPFIGFSANFNFDASDTCTATAPPVTQAPDTKVSGCTISATPVSPFKRSDWFVLLGFVGWLGWWRRKRRS